MEPGAPSCKTLPTQLLLSVQNCCSLLSPPSALSSIFLCTHALSPWSLPSLTCLTGGQMKPRGCWGSDPLQMLQCRAQSVLLPPALPNRPQWKYPRCKSDWDTCVRVCVHGGGDSFMTTSVKRTQQPHCRAPLFLFFLLWSKQKELAHKKMAAYRSRLQKGGEAVPPISFWETRLTLPTPAVFHRGAKPTVGLH